MTLLIAIILIHGFDMSPIWYLLTALLWVFHCIAHGKLE